MSRTYTRQPKPPPTFEEAKNTRQKARSAGLHPDYWYPAEQSGALKKGEVKEITFWKRSIALFRGEDGQARAIENRCAHRQLKLTTGHVNGCNVVCPYHGWTYDGDGKVVDIPHTLFGKKFPKFRVPSVPVQEKYGLIWFWPGDPKLASQKDVPHIPVLEPGPDQWTCVPVDVTWKAHHSMIIDNVSDFTHAYLHKRFRPFTDAELLGYETVGDSVLRQYDTKVGTGPISGKFVNRKKIDTNHMKLGYEYPFQWSNTDDQIKHWLFVVPIDERTTRSFFLFCFKALQVPGLGMDIPKPLMGRFMRLANEIIVKPLLQEDGDAVEAEQEGWEAHWDAPLAELNPVVKEFQHLTIRKWEEYLATQSLTPLKKKPAADAGVEAGAGR